MSSPTAPSDELCKLFSSGKRCHRDARGCPYVHDTGIPKANLKKKKKLLASRSKLQQEYTMAAQKQSSDQVVNKESLPLENGDGKKDAKPRMVCRLYVNGLQCPYINRASGCRDAHDLEARRTNLANKQKSKEHAIMKDDKSEIKSGQSKKKKKKPRESRAQQEKTGIGFSVQNRQASTDNSEMQKVPFGLSINMKVTKNESFIATNTEPSTPDTATNCPTLEKDWDCSPHWHSWATRNLKTFTAAKFLAPYLTRLENGTAPMKLFATIPKATPSGSFLYFPLLPYELREQIWKYVLDGEKYEVRITWSWKYEFGHYTQCKFVPQNCVPRLLHVNGESRYLALRNYDMTFGTNHYRGLTYFNYKTDRLFIHTRCWQEHKEIVKHLLPGDMERISRLAIPLKDFVVGDEKQIAEALTKFKNLQLLSLIVGDGLEDAPWADKKMACKIQRYIGPIWWRAYPKSKAPVVRMHVIDAVKAHYYKIDDLIW